MGIANKIRRGYFTVIFLNDLFYKKKCKKRLSSTRFWDWNSQPLEHESSPMTTGPGLPLIFTGELKNLEGRTARSIALKQINFDDFFPVIGHTLRWLGLAVNNSR